MRKKTKEHKFLHAIGRFLPYLASAVMIFALAKYGSDDKLNPENTSLNMNAMAANNYSVSADQLSELYVVASISSSLSLASTDAVSGNYVAASVLKGISQTSADKIEKPGYTPVSYSPGISNYIVSEGETMESIAQKLSAEYRTNLTTDQIRWSNNLKTTNVTVGQALSIPKTSGIVYTVKSGDTVETLATRYGAQADRIVSYNNLEETGLVDGSFIVLPGGTLPLTERPEYVPVYTYSYYGSTSDRQDMRVVYEAVTTGYGNKMVWGQCTYYAWWWRATSPYSLGPLPENLIGDAKYWAMNVQNPLVVGYGNTLRVDKTPEVGAVFQTANGWYGHVGVVLKVLDDGSLIVREMNYGYRSNVVTESIIPANVVGSFNYIH